MGWLHYSGSGITSRWFRAFLCLVFIVWGGAIALFNFERTPTRVHGEYVRALHDAEQSGQDPAAVPRPPESQMWKDGVPGLTILGVVMVLVGIAALTEPLWRRATRTRNWLIAGAVVVLLTVVGLAAVPRLTWMSSAGAQAVCLANANMIARALAEYAESHGGALPAKLSDILAVQNFRCRFDRAPNEDGSYVYGPTGIVLSDGRRVIMYCRGKHPEVVSGPDGEASKGGIPAVLSDFTTVRLPLETLHCLRRALQETPCRESGKKGRPADSRIAG